MSPLITLTLADIMSDQVRWVSPDCPLGEAARQMAEAHISSLLVMTGPAAVGILTERDLLRLLHRQTDFSIAVAQVMSTPVLTALQETTFASAYQLALTHQCRHLVVVDGAGAVVGIASETDFRRHLGGRLLRQLDDLTAVMDVEPPFLPPDTPLEQVLDLMLRQQASYALAVEGRRAVGILTERDVPRLLAEEGRARGQGLRFRDVMQFPVHGVRDDTPVSEVARLMRQRQLRHLAVLDDRGLVLGMVTLHSLMERLSANLLQEELGHQTETRIRELTRAAKDRLQSILDAIPDLIWLKDPHGIYLACNKTFERLYAATEAQIVGKRDDGFVGQEQADAIRAHDHLALAAAAPTIREDWFAFADGGYRGLFETIKTPVRDGAGNLIGVLGVARDISRLREVQDALRESERFSRSTLDALAVHLAVLDETGTIIAVNRAWREFAHANAPVPSNAFEGANYLAVCASANGQDGEEAGAVLAGIRAVMRGDQDAFSLEYPCHSPEEQRWFAMRVTRFPSDGALRLVVAHHDITERRRLEIHLETLVQARTAELEVANRELRRSDRRLKALFDLGQIAPDLNEPALLQRGIDLVVVLTESAWGYLHCVDEDQETIELSSWSTTTRTPYIATDVSHDPVSHTDLWTETVRTGQPVIHNNDTTLSRRQGDPDGHVALSRHMNVPIREGGKVRLIIGVGDKASDYDETDVQELQLIADDLWRIVTRRRAETVLAQAKEAAEAASRAKSAFLANMSHEIRTPMNAILGLTYLLQRDMTDPKPREHIAKIGGAAQQLLQLVNNVLDLSKIEAGQVTLDDTPFSVAHLIESTLALLNEQALAKGIRCDYTIDPAVPPSLRGDAQRLGQILLNFLDNAIKFSAQGRIQVDATLERASGQTLWVRLWVRDQGIGLTATQCTRIFEPFVQADDTTTRRVGGTGLGLTICKRLAHRLGGEVGVDSEFGRGSCFWVSVPLQRVGSTASGVAGPLTTPKARTDDPFSLALARRPLYAAQPSASPAPASTLEWSRTQPLLAELDALLAEDNPRALDLWRTAGPLCQAVLGSAGAPFEEALTRFEFDQALRTLRAAMAAWPQDRDASH